MSNKRASEKFAWDKGDLVIEKNPECPRCGSAEDVVPTFIGPDDPPGMHSYGDLVFPDQVFHSHWCTACNEGCGKVLTLPSLARRKDKLNP